MLARVGGLPFSMLEEFRIKEEEDYHEAMLMFQKKLQDLSQSEVLLKGVVQTSESFFERIIKFQNKPITSFRKKEFQTQRSLFQYFSRTIGKTSPFSTLTTLSPFHLEDKVFKNISTDFLKSKLQYNNQLFFEIKNWVLAQTEIHPFLNLVANPTIQQLDNDLLFLKNKLDGEPFNKIETNEVIAIILEKVNSTLSFQELVNELKEVIEAEESDIVNYLFQLIDLGLLNFVFPNLKGNSNRVGDWLRWVKSFPKFDGQDKLIHLFTFLKNSKFAFQNGNSRERIKIKTFIIKTLSDLGFEEIPIKYLFYEDVGKECKITVREEKVESILLITHQLVELIEPLMYDKMLSKVYSFFENKENKIKRIGLLDFYEQFSQQDISESEFYQNQINKRRVFWKKELKKIVQLDEKDNVNLLLQELNTIHDKMRIQNLDNQLSTRRIHSLSGHFQFFEENNLTKGVLNGISPGYGKLFGRFTSFFPTTTLQDFKKWNKEESENEIWIQNDDASIYNANSDQPFFQKKISIRNSDSSFTEAVSLENIELRWDAKLKEIELWEKQLDKRIKVFDTGVVSPSQRSLLFQILKIFGAPFVSISILTELVNELLEKDVAVKDIPRITIDKQLVIQRKGSIIPKESFYKKGKKEYREDFFQGINEWRKLFSIPEITYIKHIDSTNHKPQLIDFKSPLSVLVFEKILNSGSDAILFNEMLPTENQLEEIEGEKYCTEFVLQWKQ